MCFGQIQKHIAESLAEYMAGKSYLYGVTNGLDLSTYGNGLDADGVKLYCALMAKRVADRAIQVMGGYRYVGEYNVERLWVSHVLLQEHLAIIEVLTNTALQQKLHSAMQSCWKSEVVRWYQWKPSQEHG
jgi:alkylation response protein AidB-like acyl-CoA dehydrogenase